MVGQGEVDRGRVGRPTATARVRLSITHVYIHIIVNAQRARIQGHECIVTMYLDYNSHVHNYTYQACSTICIAMYVNSLSKWLTSYVLAHLLRITMLVFLYFTGNFIYYLNFKLFFFNIMMCVN